MFESNSKLINFDIDYISRAPRILSSSSALCRAAQKLRSALRIRGRPTIGLVVRRAPTCEQLPYNLSAPGASHKAPLIAASNPSALPASYSSRSPDHLSRWSRTISLSGVDLTQSLTHAIHVCGDFVTPKPVDPKAWTMRAVFV